MNGFQLRMPTATGMSGAEPRAQRRRLRHRDVGQRRASADRAVVVRASRATSSADGGRPPRTSAQVLRHLVQRGRRAVRHQQHADADSQATFSVRGSSFCVRTTNLNENGTSNVALTLRSRLLVHVARERLHVLDRRRRQDAVAEIEDVAGRPPARARTSSVAGEDAIERAEQQRRIEIALDARGRGRCAPTLRRAACASRRRSRRRRLRAARRGSRRCRRRSGSSARRVGASASKIRPRVRQDELAVVARRSARRPTSRTPARRRRRPRSARRGSRR